MARLLVEAQGQGSTPSTLGSLTTGLGGMDLQPYAPSLDFDIEGDWAAAYFPVEAPSSAGTSILLSGGTPAGLNEFSPKEEDALLAAASLAASDFQLPAALHENAE